MVMIYLANYVSACINVVVMYEGSNSCVFFWIVTAREEEKISEIELYDQVRLFQTLARLLF